MQRGAGADHAQHVGIVLIVERHGGGHHLHFVDVARWEKGADGTIDQAGGQDFLGGGPAFALDEAAGKLAGGIGFFAVIDDEGKEIATGDGRPFARGGKGPGIAEADDDGTVGLLGNFAGLKKQGLIAEGQFDTTGLHGEYLIC